MSRILAPGKREFICCPQKRIGEYAQAEGGGCVRRLLGLLLAAALLAVWGGPAGAHGGDLSAIVSLQPQSDHSGTLSFTIQDAYGVKVKGARVRASLRRDGDPQPPLLPGAESASGTYGLALPLPQADMAILRLEVTILTDDWTAEFPLAMGSEVSDIGVTLLHRGAPPGAASGTFDPTGLPTDPSQIIGILAVIGLPVLLAVLMQRRRRPLKK